MKCPKCRHKDTRVTVTQHCSDHTVRYCKCLNCGNKFKTEERIVKYKERFIPNNAKLDNQKVKEIREIAKSKGETGATVTSELIMTLALQYDVEYATIRNVIRKKTWKNVN